MKVLEQKAERMGLVVEELEQRLKLAGLDVYELKALQDSYKVPVQCLAELLEEMAYKPIRTPLMTKYAGVLEQLRKDKVSKLVCRELGLKERELSEVMEVLRLAITDVEKRLSEYKARGWSGYDLGNDLLQYCEDPSYQGRTVNSGMTQLMTSIASQYGLAASDLFKEDDDGYI